MSLFPWSFRNAHHHSEGANGESGAKNEAYDHDLHKAVGISEDKYEDIEEPNIVEYAVEENIIEVGYHICEREVSVAP